MKYRSKPVVKEAIQLLDHHSFQDMVRAWGDEFKKNCDCLGMPCIIKVKTPEGKMFASRGDYIVKGIKGEFYPVRKDIFEESYERVNDETTQTSNP